MAAQELNVQVISNNIANLRTTGYKKQRAAFQDLIYDHVRRVGARKIVFVRGRVEEFLEQRPVGLEAVGVDVGDVVGDDIHLPFQRHLP